MPGPSDEPGIPLFHKLDEKVRNFIWTPSLPDDVPEVAIWQAPAPVRQPEHVLSKVHTGFPVAAHVCRESRGHTLTKIRMAHLEEAGIAVPVRDFNPHLDMLHIRAMDFHHWFRNPTFYCGDTTSEIRHIAMDIISTSAHHLILTAFRELRSLKSVCLAFPQTKCCYRGTSQGPPPPTGRCRLRPLTAFERDWTTVDWAYFGSRSCTAAVAQPVNELLKFLYNSMPARVSELVSGWDEIEMAAWDHHYQLLKLKLDTRVLEVYRRGASGAEWIAEGRRELTW